MSGYTLHVHYSCNGNPRGCERARFGHCAYHDGLRMYSVTGEVDGQVVTHKFAAGGVAQAAEEMLDRFGGIKLLSVVDISHESSELPTGERT